MKLIISGEDQYNLFNYYLVHSLYISSIVSNKSMPEKQSKKEYMIE